MIQENDDVYKRIIDFEERNLNNLNVIYLFKDNNKENSQWYKAYEWSAYLLEFITNNLDENNRLKPIKKQIKDSDKTIINIGIPITSLEKYCNSKFIIDKISDANQNIQIAINILNNINIENYKQKLNEWKNSVQIKNYQNKNLKNENNNVNIYNKPITFLSIMKDIVKFNTYNRKEEDLVEFINDLKIKCADLIC